MTTILYDQPDGETILKAMVDDALVYVGEPPGDRPLDKIKVVCWQGVTVFVHNEHSGLTVVTHQHEDLSWSPWDYCTYPIEAVGQQRVYATS